jgi:excisionase family DNA binding protein
MTIGDAARLLGVSLPTMRRWDESGRFKARRHPINSYRMYERGDVMKLRKRIASGTNAA